MLQVVRRIRKVSGFFIAIGLALIKIKNDPVLSGPFYIDY